MYFGFTILSLNIACCYCYVAYEIFKGFDKNPETLRTTAKVRNSGPVNHRTTRQTYLPRTVRIPTSSAETDTLEELSTEPAPAVIPSKFQCPEDEQPVNIGTYEVPTQRDIVFLVRQTLTRRFNSYHAKALYFLKDIQEATKATAAIQQKCHGYGADRGLYKKCISQVSTKCEVITKEMVTALESQRMDVSAFTNGTVCNVKGMKADPINLIKTLAVEEASMEFALPGYLRLLSACSVYCNKTEPQLRLKKPLRHMTDQDLVVKHFLTKKNYIQLIKGSK